MKRLLRFIHRELQSEQSYLLPLRLFIGLGWIRAAAEKLMGTDWYAGQALTKFLNEQLQTGAVHFPFYDQLIHNVFLPNAAVLGWVIIIGQFMAGFAIMTGTLTNAALIGGMFMNINFVLVGKVNPSAFYLVIQTVLFVGHTGAICGLDSKLSKWLPTIFVTARTTRTLNRLEKNLFFAIACLSWLIMLLAIPSIRDFSPHSVDDPAMLLTILSGLGGLTALIIFFQNNAFELVVPTAKVINVQSAKRQSSAHSASPILE